MTPEGIWVTLVHISIYSFPYQIPITQSLRSTSCGRTATPLALHDWTRLVQALGVAASVPIRGPPCPAAAQPTQLREGAPERELSRRRGCAAGRLRRLTCLPAAGPDERKIRRTAPTIGQSVGKFNIGGRRVAVKSRRAARHDRRRPAVCSGLFQRDRGSSTGRSSCPAMFQRASQYVFINFTSAAASFDPISCPRRVDDYPPLAAG